MKIINLQQNTPEWLYSRAFILGGSEIPVIVQGTSPYNPNQIRDVFIESKASNLNKIYEMKEADYSKKEIIKLINIDSSDKTMKAGHWVEDFMRPIVELETGIDFKPAVGQSILHPFMGCSFDGLNRDKDCIWECKYTGNDKVLNAMVRNEVPEHFMLQVQYNLMVSKGSHAYLTLVSLKRDRKTIKNRTTLKLSKNQDVMNIIKEWVFYTYKEIKKRLNYETEKESSLDIQGF